MRRRLEAELGQRLHDAPGGRLEDLRAGGPPRPDTVGTQLRLTTDQLLEVLEWWESRPRGDCERVGRLELLAGALLGPPLRGAAGGENQGPPLRGAAGGENQGPPLRGAAGPAVVEAEREILVGLERLQHWSVGEPSSRRARLALESTQRAFDRYYSLAPVAARSEGYPRLARLLRMGRALAAASMEVARLD